MKRHSSGSDYQPQRPDPEQGRSATTMGFFMVPVFFFGAVVMIGIAITFTTVPDQSHAVGYVCYALAGVLVALAVWRITRIATGKMKY